MRANVSLLTPLVITFALIWLTPLLGFLLMGSIDEVSFSMPPQPFSRPARATSLSTVILLSILLLVVSYVFLKSLMHSQRSQLKVGKPTWALFLSGIVFGIFWILAWTRFEWMGAFQYHTFFMLWMSFIVFLNIFVYTIGGQAPLFWKMKSYLALFPISAGMWWLFEFLNRFSQNWNYHHIEHFSSYAYVLFATLSFSTVLPAVAVMRAFIQVCYPRIESIGAVLAWNISASLLYLFAGSALLILLFLPLFPDELYPIVWIAPVLVYVAIARRMRVPCFFDAIRWGDWSQVMSYALSGVLCGILWECWNVQSLAHWTYRISYVGVMPIFKMPLLGYLGYIPFGILCGLVVELAYSWGKTLKNTDDRAEPIELEGAPFPILF